MIKEGLRTGFPIRRFLLHFGYFRVMRMVTVIAMAIAIVTVSVIVIMRCLLSAQT